MSADAVLSRIRLREDAPIRALWHALVPPAGADRVARTHQLLWTLFGDSAARTRDFLWREERPGTFVVLSARPPSDVHDLFHIESQRPFAFEAKAGDRARFSLRVNATVARGGGAGTRSKPCDVVMDALRAEGAGDRAVTRAEVLGPAAAGWLRPRSERDGFRVDELIVVAYRVHQIPRPRGAVRASIGVLDLEGELTVLDAALLRAAVLRGFGRAKSFGNGLLLLHSLERATT
jgi:CRISPR system Cascade subunit CasE